MRPSVMTAAESTGCSPLAKSTVRTVSMPRPEKELVRRTWRHWTSGRGVPAFAPARLIRYEGSQRVAFERLKIALFLAVAASAAAGVDAVGCTNGSAAGI